MAQMAWRRIVLGLVCGIFFINAARAAGATGEWLVKERTAIIRVADCAGVLWGVIAWEATAGIDANNPDPVKRTRPTLGIPILLAMKPSEPNRWDGQIYNERNGKIYSSYIRLTETGNLQVRGCVLGFLCGGEDWTRADPVKRITTVTDAAICAGVKP